MSKSAPPSPLFDKKKVVAENRRARFDYFVEDRFEAGGPSIQEQLTA